MTASNLRLAVASAVALTSLLAGSAGVALAHAQYGGSTPATNSTVSAVPKVLQVTYTEELSDIDIKVTGPDGSNVTTAPATFDLENRHNASVPLRDAGPGVYTVLWHNVSGDDGDPNDGTFLFTEAPSQVAAPSQAAAPSTAAPAHGSPAPQPPVAASQASTGPACVDNGLKTPGVNDVRADTYCKRQAIRDLFKGKIDDSGLNYALGIGEGLESALEDSCTVDSALCVLPKGFAAGS